MWDIPLPTSLFVCRHNLFFKYSDKFFLIFLTSLLAAALLHGILLQLANNLQHECMNIRRDHALHDADIAECKANQGSPTMPTASDRR